MSSFDLQSFLPYLINRAALRLSAAFADEIRKLDLTVTMWRVLTVLLDAEPQRLGELAEATSVEVAALGRLLSAMQTRNLVTRTRPDDDSRAVEVALSREGRVLAERLLPAARRYEATALKGFTPEEIELMCRLMTRLYDNVRHLQPKLD